MNRRHALLTLGGAGMAILTGRLNRDFAAAAPGGPACVVTPRQTEGPFFLDKQLERADIRSDLREGSLKGGVPLTLSLRIMTVRDDACAPLARAIVDLWHCDAAGVYSGVERRGRPEAAGHFLRGYQVTDDRGVVQFITVYPGWYPGRTVHIHFKVRARADRGAGRELTSQLYFDDDLTDRVHAQEPYAGRGRRAIRNSQDGLFRSGGRELMLSVVEKETAYAATFDIGLRMT